MSGKMPGASSFSLDQLRRILASVLVGAAIIGYGSSLKGELVLDDITCLRDNPSLGQFNPREVPPGFHHRPIGRSTFTLNYLYGGRQADGSLRVESFHLTNVVIHLAAALVLFGLVQRTLRLPRFASWSERDALWFAFGVALIWLVHPLQTAAVSYLIQRLESLMGLCFLATLYCLVRGATARMSWPWYLAALLAIGLGMGSKEVMAAVLPVALLYDRVFLAGSWRETLARRGWVYAGGAAAVAWLGYWLTQLPPDFGSGVGLTEVTPWQHLRSQPGVILYYLGLAFWPARLCLSHGWPIAIDPLQVYGLGAVIVALLAASLIALWYRPEIGFLGVTFFLILAPTSSFIPLGDTAFEYRMYLPLAPLVVLVLALLWQFTAWLVRSVEARRLVRLGLVALLASGLLVRTMVRNRDYESAATLWAGVVDMYPKFPRALVNLGIEREKEGKFDEARGLFAEALAEYPDFPEAQLQLAQALARDKEYQPSLKYYRLYLAARPDHVAAHVGLAQTASLAGETAAANEHYELALKLEPERKETWRSYGNWRMRQGNFADAMAHYRRALEIDPQFDRARLALATALLELGEDEAALAELEAIRDPSLAAARLTKVAWIKATTPLDSLRNGAAALEAAQKAEAVFQGRDADSLDALAAAFAESGRFAEAVACEEKALKLVSLQSPVGQAYSQRLEMYEQRIPFRRVARNAAYDD